MAAQLSARNDSVHVPFRAGGPFFLIAGPCVLEDRALNLKIAGHLAEVSHRYGLPVVFKASFDKANRTSVEANRGPGLRTGSALLQEVREETGLPVLTDVHLPEQVETVSASVDALQIPAFLCRQTDLLLAAGASGLPINVKKGQWMDPEQIAHSVAKVQSAGGTAVAVTERGTAFGYGRWIVDMRSFQIMRGATGCPAVFDGTHSVQLPGGGGTHSGGEPQFVETLCRAAVGAGADGLFLETHPDPGSAPSDGSNMLPLERLEPLVEEILKIHDLVRRGGRRKPDSGGAG